MTLRSTTAENVLDYALAVAFGAMVLAPVAGLAALAWLVLR